MNLPPSLLFEVSQQVLCWNQIADYFGMTEEQRKDPNSGKWVIEWIKNMQQVTAAYKTQALFPDKKADVAESGNPLLTSDVLDELSKNA